MSRSGHHTSPVPSHPLNALLIQPSGKLARLWKSQSRGMTTGEVPFRRCCSSSSQTLLSLARSCVSGVRIIQGWKPNPKGEAWSPVFSTKSDMLRTPSATPQGQCRRRAKWHRSHGIEVEYGAFRSVLNEIPPRAMMGSGEASGRGRAQKAAELAITNPLLDETSMICAQGVLVSISGGPI